MGGRPRIVLDTLGIRVRGYRILRHMGLVVGRRLRIVWDTPSILGDTQAHGASHGWTSLDSPGYPEYPWCIVRFHWSTWILRHRS